MVISQVGAQDGFYMVPRTLASTRIKVSFIHHRKVRGIVWTISAGSGPLPPLLVHIAEIIVGQYTYYDFIVVKGRSHGLVKQGILQRPEIAASPEIEMFPAGVLL